MCHQACKDRGVFVVASAGGQEPHDEDRQQQSENREADEEKYSQPSLAAVELAILFPHDDSVVDSEPRCQHRVAVRCYGSTLTRK